jgi:tRNA 2-thiouridine synthesizing protein A
MDSTAIAQRVDARGLSCPLPIVKTAQAMKGLAAGQQLEVLATDPGSVKDFEAWATSTGNPLLAQSVEDGVYRFVLQKR